MKYLSVSEYANKYHKDTGYIRKLLAQGRLEGFKVGKQWVINENSRLPKDERIKKGEYKYFRKIKNINLYSDMQKMIKELTVVYKDTLHSVILYGSYSRGEQTKESDIDIALIVDEERDKDKYRKMNEINAKYDLRCNKIFSLIEIEKNKLKEYGEYIPFYKNVINEGIELWTKE